jgi:hypothetical protein
MSVTDPYAFGAARQQPVTKVVAVRSAYPWDSAMAWLVADPNLPPSGGGHWASYREMDVVTDWIDLIPTVDV